MPTAEIKWIEKTAYHDLLIDGEHLFYLLDRGAYVLVVDTSDIRIPIVQQDFVAIKPNLPSILPWAEFYAGHADKMLSVCLEKPSST